MDIGGKSDRHGFHTHNGPFIELEDVKATKSIALQGKKNSKKSTRKKALRLQ